MLILAGVSINAIVGDNGILTRTQYATFLSEMSAVEEAVQMWKAGEVIDNQGNNTTAIPTNGMCQVNDLTSKTRLVGEVGYYRIWSIGETQPTIDILSDASSFNSKFESELVFYPAGVQDLYYLNNEACGIDSKKTYAIDAATGMIYSMTGISLKGVSCYSSTMAKAVMNGDNTTPNFVAAEVSGIGSDEKLAGNVQSEFLEDGVTPNPNYNPNGFQIIASQYSNNIFKLYNNGDLYGKGIKGKELNTPVAEMEALNNYVWKEYNVPQEITAGVKNTFIGSSGCIFYVDNNDDLWVIGENVSNRLGLTQEQQQSYTGREVTKVNLDNEKVEKIWSGCNASFILTKSNKLLASGSNASGELGIGNTVSTNKFVEVTSLSNVENIERIYCMISENEKQNMCIAKYKDNTFYYCGNPQWSQLGTGDSNANKKTNIFLQIWNGELGPDIDQDIEDLLLLSSTILLMKDDTSNDNLNGELYFTGYRDYFGGELDTTASLGGFRKYANPEMNHIQKIYIGGNSIIIERDNIEGEKEIWAIPGSSSFFDLGDDNHFVNYPIKLELPEKLQKEKVKEIYTTTNGFYVLSQAGSLFGMGNNKELGLDLDVGFTKEIIYLNKNGISSLYKNNIYSAGERNSILILNDGSKQYITSDSNLMFGDDILEKKWSLVAKNVLYKSGIGNFYIDKNNSLYVNGDARVCGLGYEEYEYIPNFIKCTDSNIDGNVVKAWQDYSGKVLYVLLKDKTLWATGLYMEDVQVFYPGWGTTENKSNFVKILDDVLFFDTANTAKLAITSTQAYCWGGNSYGLGSSSNNEPTVFVLPNEIGGIDNISKIMCFSDIKSAIITKSGKLFLCGRHDGRDYDGGIELHYQFREYTHNITLNENEKIIDISRIDYSNALILTNQGRIFSWGNKKYLGIGIDSMELRENLLNSQVSNIKSITAGLGWYIMITEDGKVLGTGKNTYGILGRWIGIDRNSPNSRYKTAFEWVECPELEI